MREPETTCPNVRSGNTEGSRCCTADDGTECLGCQADEEALHAYWCAYFGQAPKQSERQYRDDLVDAGRGHLVRP